MAFRVLPGISPMIMAITSSTMTEARTPRMGDSSSRIRYLLLVLRTALLPGHAQTDLLLGGLLLAELADDPALEDNPDAVRKRKDLVQVRGNQEDRLAARGRPPPVRAS